MTAFIANSSWELLSLTHTAIPSTKVSPLAVDVWHHFNAVRVQVACGIPVKEASELESMSTDESKNWFPARIGNAA
jgi:hypothetical protein